jgi:hypothetical protein
MSLPYSLDEIARTTDEMAVRQRFDQRNRFWLQWLLGFFFFVALIALLAGRRSNTVLDVLAATANHALIAWLFYIVRDSYRGERARLPARWFRKHINATVLTYVIVQFALVLYYTRADHDWIGWVMVLPWCVVAFRMSIAEHVLLHAVLTGAGLAMPALAAATPFRHNDASGYYIGLAVNNAFALGVELFGWYRLRRRTRGEWNERRTAAREQIRMRDELRYARELQISMLPECAPNLDWADLCAISLPATEVGGDYYDYFVDRDRVALVCGDVAGHGMASGLVLSALRSGFTLLRDSLDDPAAVLRRLHDLVAQTSRRRMLVTVTVVLLDRNAKRATIASAGHPPVILRRANGSVETIDLYAPPLGVRLPVNIPQRQLDIAPGDIFVLHSDGIYETTNADDESYGLDRLQAVVREHDGPAEQLRDAIIDNVETFRGSAPQADDVTVVVARVV